MLAEPAPTPAVAAQAELLLVLTQDMTPSPPDLHAQYVVISCYACVLPSRTYRLHVALLQVKAIALALSNTLV
jgi:hypothetical protein